MTASITHHEEQMMKGASPRADARSGRAREVPAGVPRLRADLRIVRRCVQRRGRAEDARALYPAEQRLRGPVQRDRADPVASDRGRCRRAARRARSLCDGMRCVREGMRTARREDGALSDLRGSVPCLRVRLPRVDHREGERVRRIRAAAPASLRSAWSRSCASRRRGRTRSFRSRRRRGRRCPR